MNFPLWARIAVGLGLAATLAYMSTPVAILAARRLAFYDRPAGYKGHARPTPYLGGAAVMLAFALALLLGAGHLSRTLPLLGGVAVLFALGTVDDRHTVSPHLRVVVELLIGGLLGADGVGWHLGAGAAVDAVTTAIWVVAVVNAFNLFDNMDGAASTMALVVGAGVCVLAVQTGNQWVTVGSAALCGACLGFLPHNLARPARIFLGDGGSMPLGFAVAILVANAARGAEPSMLALVTGLLLVGVPALDTCLVIVSRRRRGISILTGGQDHLTHRTRRRMRTARRVALVLGSTQALVSALVIVATREGSAALVYIALAFVVCAAAAIVGLDERTPSRAVPGADAAGDADAAGVAVESQRWREPRPSVRERAWFRYGGDVTIGALGLAAGVSPFFAGYYGTGVWVPLALVVTVMAAVGAIGRTRKMRLPSIVAAAGIAGIGLWSLLSSTWAQAVEQATTEGNRWLSYAALFLLMIVLLQSPRRSKLLIGGAFAGIAIVAISVLIRMLGPDPSTLLLGGRLNGPLGYIDGEGCVFAMAAWVGVALAERREPLLAGGGAGGAVLMSGLALLSESRGAAVATLVAVLLTLAFIPGLRRRVLALVFIAAGFAFVAGPVSHVYASRNGHLTSSAHHAAIMLILTAAVTGVVWGLAVAAARHATRNERRAALASRIATAATVLLLVSPVVAVAVEHSRVGRTVSRQWNAFVHLGTTSSSASSGQTRLFSGGGYRYDYWRIAWNAFADNPVGGVGAGNYPAAYFKHRRTNDAIQNPHSLMLQILSELGIVGLLLLLVTIVGVVLGARKLRATARRSPTARTLMVAATGMSIVWFVDTSGDWMHLLPGVTAIALAAVAIICREGGFASPIQLAANSGPRRMLGLAGISAVAFVLAVTGASLARAGLVQFYLHQARAELATHPAAAIRNANRVLRIDGANLDAYYIKAAGQARFDQAAEARSTLLAAAQEDPSSFVTWTLLGDLEVRLRNFSTARSFYQRAHELDPLDPALATLVTNPASGLSTGT